MADAWESPFINWPNEPGRAIAPVRVGMDVRTGQILYGWDCTMQSIELLFTTRFHERIYREWAGSLVPHILGESAIESTILRFWFAIITAIDLWEPNYKVRRVRILNRDRTDPGPAALNSLTSADELRAGHVTFRLDGIHRPRGHLGDPTPEGQRSMGLLGTGNGQWQRFRI